MPFLSEQEIAQCDSAYAEALARGDLSGARQMVDKFASSKLVELAFRDYPRHDNHVFMDIGASTVDGHPCACIHNLGVERGHRGKGWGSALLDFTVSLADKMGVTLDLEVGGGEDAEEDFDLPAWYMSRGFCFRGDGSMGRLPRGVNPTVAYTPDGKPLPLSQRFGDDGEPLAPLVADAGKTYLDVVACEPSDISWIAAIDSDRTAFQLKDGRKVVVPVPEMSFYDDKDFYEAVERGDDMEARRMLDKAAKDGGYVIGPVFHGTTRGGFSEFRLGPGRKNETLSFGVHFWYDKAMADRYAEDPLVRRSKSGTPEVKSAYLAIQNPLDAERIVEEGSPEFELLRKIAGRKFLSMKNESGIPIAYIKNNLDDAVPSRVHGMLIDAGYDGLLYSGDIGSVSPYGRKFISAQGKAVIAFSPGQIKPADISLKSPDGRPIPLSQRFLMSRPVVLPELAGKTRGGFAVSGQTKSSLLPHAR